jgi:hypothetical protein
MLMSSLQAARVEGYRESFGRIGKHVAEDLLCPVGLALEKIYRPNRISSAAPEFNEKHPACNELVYFTAFGHLLIAPSIFAPLVGLFLKLSSSTVTVSGWVLAAA